MEIQLVFAALRRHRLATILIALEIALACAVLSNACFMIANRLTMMRINSGVDESSLALLQVTGYDSNASIDLNARVVAGLRAIPNVKSVSVINAVPFGKQAGASGITTDAAGEHFGGVVDFYVGNLGSIKALGLKLVAGHFPNTDDFQPMSSYFPTDAKVLITRSLAAHLWPDVDPLGRQFWSGKFHFRVIGVIDHLAIAQPESRSSTNADWSVFAPALPGKFLSGTYLLRANQKDVPRVLSDARAAIAKIAPDVVLDRQDSQTLSELRHIYFASDRAMAGMLLGVIVALLMVTALGIVGLTSFWVQQRRRSIGIRRAVGATRVDILRYFQVENFLIVSFGIALGMLLALVLNMLLMKHYELPHLPLIYLPIGAITLWLLGQFAVLGPALHAATVPPMVATRTE